MLYSFSIVVQNLTLTPPATLSKVKLLLRKKFNIDLDKRSSLRLSKPIVLFTDPDRSKLEAYAKQLYSYGLDVDVVEEKVKELEIQLKSEALLRAAPVEDVIPEVVLREPTIQVHRPFVPVNAVPILNIKPLHENGMQVVEKDYFTIVRSPIRRMSQAIIREVRHPAIVKKIVLVVLFAYSVFFFMQINTEREKVREFEKIQQQLMTINSLERSVSE